MCCLAEPSLYGLQSNQRPPPLIEPSIGIPEWRQFVEILRCSARSTESTLAASLTIMIGYLGSLRTAEVLRAHSLESLRARCLGRDLSRCFGGLAEVHLYSSQLAIE